MSTTENELESFHQYAREQLHSSDDDLSIDELFDLWRAENPSDQAHAENVAAVAAAIEDFKQGDRGRPAGELSRQLRDELDREQA